MIKTTTYKARFLVPLLIAFAAGCSQFDTQQNADQDAREAQEDELFADFMTEEVLDDSVLDDSAPEEQPAVTGPVETNNDLWQRIRDGYQILPEQLPPGVAEIAGRYAKNVNHLNKALHQAEPYIYHVTQQLDAGGMPLELALLPLIESTYNPRAYSPSHAVGLWQFISSTAKAMGLQNDRWYDARYDVVASTQAAIGHLQYLHTKFSDWPLALAAYNCGEGCVSRAIQRNQSRGEPTNFWSLKLPRETRRYVPKLMGLAAVIATPERYAVTLPAVKNQPYFAVVGLPAQVDLQQVAEVTGVSGEVINQLNPAYRRSITPPGNGHHLLLPQRKAASLQTYLNCTSPDNWVPYNEYIVARGDTLSQIAASHQVPLRWIRDNNQLRSDHLSIGQVLRIPRSGERLPALADTTASSYKVKSGDSLWSIARQFKTTVRQLRADNQLTSDSLRVGEVLQLRGTAKPASGQKITYKVRRGDSLYVIAKRFDVAISEITNWNKLNKKAYLKPGQRLTLYLKQG